MLRKKIKHLYCASRFKAVLVNFGKIFAQTKIFLGHVQSLHILSNFTRHVLLPQYYPKLRVTQLRVQKDLDKNETRTRQDQDKPRKDRERLQKGRYKIAKRLRRSTFEKVLAIFRQVGCQESVLKLSRHSLWTSFQPC